MEKAIYYIEMLINLMHMPPHTFNTGGVIRCFRLINQRADISLIEDWWTYTIHYIKWEKTISRVVQEQRRSLNYTGVKIKIRI